MFQYVFGFLVGTVTTYICLKGQLEQFDQRVNNIYKKIDKLERRIL